MKAAGGTSKKARKAAKKIAKIARKTAKRGWGLKSKAKKSYGKRRKAQKKAAKKALRKKVTKIGAGAVWKKIWKVHTHVSQACNVHGNVPAAACRFDAKHAACFWNAARSFVVTRLQQL